MNISSPLFTILRLALAALVAVAHLIQPASSIQVLSSGQTPTLWQTVSAPTQSAFESAPCMFNVPAGAQEGKDVLCGYVSVPEEHANPDGPQIRLAVVIYKARGPNPQPDPLFLAQGGPGGSTIDTYAEHIFTSDLLTNRDIVLFDQRGTLKSNPVLYCTEIDRLTADLIEKDLPYEEYDALEQQAMQACRQRLASQGIDLSAFDSLENAADVDTVRQALGYGQINLYGVSYGTLLALHTLHQYPASLRSVILDGVVPPQTNFNLEGAKTEDRAFTRLFDACRQDPDCNREYPDLENVFFTLVDKLDAQPALVEMTDSETHTVYRHAVIDGETFLSGIFQMLYAGELLPALPRMIYDARDGNFDVFARILSILVFDRSVSYGMYYSVICAEDADFSATDQDLSGVRPYIANMEKRSLASLLETCQAWNVTPLGPSADQPVTSDVPVLLLSGYFDPVTPADFANQAAATLSHSYSYVFPAGGHGQMISDKCADQIILSFLDDPSRPPDAACLQDETGPVFFTRANLISLPNLLPLLNLEPKATAQFLLLIACLLFMGSSYLVYPVAWLVGLGRQRSTGSSAAPLAGLESNPPYSAPYEAAAASGDVLLAAPYSPTEPVVARPPALVRAFSWMATLATLLLAVFLVAFVVIAFSMALDNDNRLFYGLGSDARPWFFLPPLFALLALGMTVAAVQAWTRRYGSPARRVYNTLLVLAALAAVVILGIWGALMGWLPW